MKRKTREWEETAHYKSQERHTDNTHRHTRWASLKKAYNRPKRRDGPMTRNYTIKTKNKKPNFN